MTFSLSRFSIRQQIVFGYIPVFLLLGVLGFSSLKEYRQFNRNFLALQDVTRETTVFLEIERDMLELRRNVLVYSNTGYKGVIKKIEFLHKQIEKEFAQILPIVEKDKEIEARFLRMLEHYNAFKNDFQEVREQRVEISGYYKNDIGPRFQVMEDMLDSWESSLSKQRNYEDAHTISRVHKRLLELQGEVLSVRTAHDASRIREAKRHSEYISTTIEGIKKRKIGQRLDREVEELELFQEDLQQYNKAFSTIVKRNRTYIHLLNVVLAGRVAEIDSLSKELEVLVAEHSAELNEDISQAIAKSKQNFLVLSLFAGIAGLISSILIARGIAKPVNKMAETLSSLAGGRIDIDVPGQDRNDEVGSMAKAANEFKLMAQQLENQTNELEEFAYRTSHDLRSPLVSSISLLDMAQRAMNKENYDKAHKSVDLVRGSLKKLDELVSDILALTRTKNVEENISSIDVEEVYQETIKKMSHLDGFSRLDVHHTIDIEGDFISYKSRFVLIFENLISNAIKYQDYEKEESYINVNCFSLKNDLILEVVDNGIGIPEKQRDKLFTMFKRFHPKIAFGSGLGLYMMKNSADILGGEISYKPNENGSTFRLHVPMNVL